MMRLEDFEQYVEHVFKKEKLDSVRDKGEFGFTHIGEKEIVRVGYCTNLTVETAEMAVANKIDLLLTHHDAWDFMEGMREACLAVLEKGNVTHFYVHLPLDAAEFGNNTTLLEKLGFTPTERFALEEGFYCGCVGERKEPMSFEVLVQMTEALLEEPIKHWQNHSNKVKKIGVVTGAGFSSKTISEAFDLGCDVYFTGEKLLYTVEHAKFKGINLMVGSHTFTEIYGLEHLTAMMKTRYPSIAVIKLSEAHIE